MRTFGALDGAVENFGPFDDAMRKLETLNKPMGKVSCGGGLNDLMGKTGNWALDGTMEHLGPLDDAVNKLETLAMGEIGPLKT